MHDFGHISEWESEWLLFNANSAIFQLYHGENKLIFNDMMMRSRCNRSTSARLVGFYSASLAHRKNSPRVDISLHLDTLPWFRANQPLLFLLNLYLHLYLYSAGTDHGYKCTRRRAVGLVQLLEGTTKALYCLCAHYAVLKVVPIDYSLWKEWIFPDVCLALDEFEGSRVVHCLSIYYIWCFCCLAFLFLLFIVSFK
jgi:hypothetical protein